MTILEIHEEQAVEDIKECLNDNYGLDLDKFNEIEIIKLSDALKMILNLGYKGGAKS